jgi:hypothetical protein
MGVQYSVGQGVGSKQVSTVLRMGVYMTLHRWWMGSAQNGCEGLGGGVGAQQSVKDSEYLNHG